LGVVQFLPKFRRVHGFVVSAGGQGCSWARTTSSVALRPSSFLGKASKIAWQRSSTSLVSSRRTFVGLSTLCKCTQIASSTPKVLMSTNSWGKANPFFQSLSFERFCSTIKKQTEIFSLDVSCHAVPMATQTLSAICSSLWAPCVVSCLWNAHVPSLRQSQ